MGEGEETAQVIVERIEADLAKLKEAVGEAGGGSE